MNLFAEMQAARTSAGPLPVLQPVSSGCEATEPSAGPCSCLYLIALRPMHDIEEVITVSLCSKLDTYSSFYAIPHHHSPKDNGNISPRDLYSSAGKVSHLQAVVTT